MGASLLLLSGAPLLAAVTPLPAPRARISHILEPVLDQVHGCWATPTSVIGLGKVVRDGKAVHVIQNWDAAGEGVPVERPGPEMDAAFVRGDRLYFVSHYGMSPWDMQGWNLSAATDDHLVYLRGGAVVDQRYVRFVNPSPFFTVGEADMGFPVGRIIARERDFLLLGSGTLATMEYPRLLPTKVVKAKVTKVPLKVRGVLYFGPGFALVEAGSDRTPHLVVWGEKGAERILKVTGLPDLGYTRGWAEAAGELYVADGGGRLLRIVAGDRSATAEPVGMPLGMRISKLHTGNETSLFVTTEAHPGIQRLETGGGVRLDVGTSFARERAGAMRFPVTLDRPSPDPVTFSYETRPRGAVAGEDYTPVSGTVTIPPGDTSVEIEVPLLEDFVIERPECFELHVTGCAGAWCDRPVATGRIPGSGLRIQSREEIPWQIIDTFSTQTLPAARTLSFPEGVAEASRLGFASFGPIKENRGRYFYAVGDTLEGLELRTDSRRLCQFDATTGELLNVFSGVSKWKVDGEQLLLGAFSTSLTRYGFFDGLPVPVLSTGSLRENGGLQVIAAISERSHLPLDFMAESPDPALGLTEVVGTAPGDIEFRADPPNDSKVLFSRKFEFPLRTIHRETGATSTVRVALTLADDDFAYTTFVPAGEGAIDALATDGRRLWTGAYRGDRLQSFTFADGKLAPDLAWLLPKKSLLHWVGTASGHALAFDGSRLVTGLARDGKPGLISPASGAAGHKGWQAKSLPPAGPLVLAGRYLAVGEPFGTVGAPGKVRIYEASSGKELRVIDAPDSAPGFGYCLAHGNGILWIASPPAGRLAGEVCGYSLDDFSLVRTVTSPEPQNGGVFGISIAADDQHLVIGEPSRSAAGAVWVFDGEAASLLKRLDPPEGSVVNGFGTRVATRGGRFLASGGSIPPGLDPAVAVAARSPRSVIIISPPSGGWPVDRVVLWSGLNASPLLLYSRGESSHSYGGGQRIALLDDCAVYSSMNGYFGENAGLQVYVFPPESSSAASTRLAAAGWANPPVWPAPGAPQPRWHFLKNLDGGFEIEIDLGSGPASSADLWVEWSGDLKDWTPVALLSGDSVPGSRVSSIAAGEGGVLRFSFPARDEAKGYFRLCSPE